MAGKTTSYSGFPYRFVFYVSELIKNDIVIRYVKIF